MYNHLYLEKEIAEIDQFHEEGFNRVKTWYKTPEERRQEVTGLDIPPHESMLERAAGFVEWGLGIQVSIRGTIDDDPGVTEIYEIFLAIGSEMLLKAGILKIDPEYYFENSSTERSMDFEKAKNKILGELSQELTDDQRKRLTLVLDLLKIKRDESVHFGFHRQGHHGHPKEIYKALDYLFLRFGGENKDINEVLRKQIEEQQQLHVGLDYEQVKYPTS